MLGTNLIEIKNFHVSYGKKLVLKNLSFHVKAKECLTLLGESGVGKTTLLRCIIGLKRPTNGEIFVEGENVVEMDEEKLLAVRKKVAYAFQNGALFDSMTVFENLALPLTEHTQLSFQTIKKRVKKELEEFDLQGTEKLYPSELSGGMKKRVGIARCMMLKPKVILYDEPTVSLDPYNTANLVKTMLKLKKKGTTSILVTHNMSVAMQISDRIALLSEGKIVAIGTPETIEKDYNVLLKNFMKGIKGGLSYEKISH
ncbi:MAG: ATP-binding cassette domain-containing protein [Bdellovibrionales bacterium]|nr:ATP-binding cassette domain-containing protein [Bdellovibrionales bacterium]